MYDKNSINKVIILGNLGGDPNVNYTKNNTKVANLSVATTTVNTSTGEEVAEWHRVTAFGNQAEAAEKYLSKGSKVYVEGRTQTNKFTDKEGIERSTKEVIANQVQFLSKGPNKETGTPAETAESKGEQTDDDLPF
jgi:single-strand DNA-binding protein